MKIFNENFGPEKQLLKIPSLRKNVNQLKKRDQITYPVQILFCLQSVVGLSGCMSQKHASRLRLAILFCRPALLSHSLSKLLSAQRDPEWTRLVAGSGCGHPGETLSPSYHILWNRTAGQSKITSTSRDIIFESSSCLWTSWVDPILSKPIRTEHCTSCAMAKSYANIGGWTITDSWCCDISNVWLTERMLLGSVHGLQSGSTP